MTGPGYGCDAPGGCNPGCPCGTWDAEPECELCGEPLVLDVCPVCPPEPTEPPDPAWGIDGGEGEAPRCSECGIPLNPKAWCPVKPLCPECRGVKP